MRRSLLVVICFVIGGMARTASGGVGLHPTDEELLTTQGNVAAAVVIEETSLAGTRAAPPRVKLLIDDIIHGRTDQRRIEATWLAADFMGGNEWERPTPAWFAEPVSAPPAGTRLILLLIPKGTEWQVSYRCRYPDTPQVRRRVRKAIADYFGWLRWIDQRDLAARRHQQVTLRSWRSQATPSALTRSATDADFVGIGEVDSLEGDMRATVTITEVLKGKPRQNFGDEGTQVNVPIPPVAYETFHYGDARPQRFVFFLAEVGGDLDRRASYALSGLGWVIADQNVRQVVRRAARGRARPRPRCLVMFGGFAHSPVPDAVRKSITEAFVEAGTGRCLVGTTRRWSIPSSPDWAVDKIRETFPGTSRTILVSIDRTGVATLSGIRVDSAANTVLFEGETWPSVPSAQQGFAQRLLELLVIAH
jgi:hypothetical protein